MSVRGYIQTLLNALPFGTRQPVQQAFDALYTERSGVTAGTYGSSTAIPVLTIDARGRVTAAVEAITIAATGSSGKVVQVVNTQTGAVATGSTYIPDDDSIPQNTEGDQYMSLAITPTNASNLLKIDVVFNGGCSESLRWTTVALFQDSGANALAAGREYNSVATAFATVAFSHYMTAGTTSATTFKVRAGGDINGASSMTFNGQGGSRKLGGVLASSITITELAP